MEAFLNVLGGAVLGAVVSWWFARQSTQQLVETQEAQAETHRQVSLLLRALEGAGVIELNRNEAGEATGLSLTLTALNAAVVGVSGTTAELTLGSPAERPPD